ncbi:hypothetical protein [Phocaeicola coprophilus]|uniref:hypothetical protein n=1 Tax=Phocaeicola coprophilus TaxID=387090 RepID=UPI001D708A02|nr:hypothetical protein [Phocaeicola coprophilus]HJE47830.1 hypothetical protein [Phocaeicola coprophilus]
MIRPGNFSRSCQRPHDTFALTGQCKKIDRTIRPQRPHDPASTTAQFSRNDRTIQPQRLHTSVKAVRRLFPLPFIFFCRKRKKGFGLF